VFAGVFGIIGRKEGRTEFCCVLDTGMRWDEMGGGIDGYIYIYP
jgi:hypothetical protein